MLSKLKLLLGISSSDTSKDDLLTLLIQQSIADVLAYTHRTEDDTEMLEPVILQVAVVRYNLVGNEGLKGETYSGVSFSYLDSYPANILYNLRSFRRIRVVK